jgi:hypothetical protein
MGAVTWLAAGALAFLLARIIPLARRRRKLGELTASLAAAFILGIAATALDFGGWREADPRAALFAGLGSLAILGMMRVLTYNFSSEGPP